MIMRSAIAGKKGDREVLYLLYNVSYIRAENLSPIFSIGPLWMCHKITCLYVSGVIDERVEITSDTYSETHPG